MVDTISALLQKHFSLVIIAALVLGFVVPGVDAVPPSITLVLLAITIFVSSFKIELSDIHDIRVRPVVVLYAARFIVLPILLWFLLRPFDPTMALAVLLLSMAPTGVAAPGVAGLYGGNVSLTLFVLTISSVLAPFVIPGVVGLLVASEIDIDLFGVFRTLLITVVLPLLVYAVVHRHKPTRTWVRRLNTLLVVPLIAALVIIVVSQQREFMIQHIDTTIQYFLVTVLVTGIYYGFGWLLGSHHDRAGRIGYTLGSGVNNTALAIVIGFLYFETAVSVFLVTSELAWVLGMVFVPVMFGARSRAGVEP